MRLINYDGFTAEICLFSHASSIEARRLAKTVLHITFE